MGRTRSPERSAQSGTATLARRAGRPAVLLVAAVVLMAGCGSGKTKTVVPGNSGGSNSTAPATTKSGGGYGY
jgi:hypothetical protein